MTSCIRILTGAATASAVLLSLPVVAHAAPADDGPAIQVLSPSETPAEASPAPAGDSTAGAQELPSGQPAVDGDPAVEAMAPETTEAEMDGETVAGSDVGPLAAPPPQVHFGPQTDPTRDDLAKPYNRNRGLGMTVAGFTIFGSFYLITAGMGTMAIDNAFAFDWEEPDDWEAQRREKYGQRLLIPVAGPFLATSHAGSATGGLATAMLGVAQIAGLTLGIVGAVRLSKARRQHRFAMGVAPTPDGGAMSMSLRF